MGTYEDCCFTFRPESRSVDEVAAAVEEFLERPFEDLPALPDDVTEYSSTEDYYERDRMRVETDDDRGQVYLGARTHSTTNRDAWRYWLLELGIGDGLLGFVWWHETSVEGYGELWTWDTADGYVPADLGELAPDAGQREVYDGEERAKGAKIAERFADAADITPARHHELHGFLTPGDDGFVPRMYREQNRDG